MKSYRSPREIKLKYLEKKVLDELKENSYLEFLLECVVSESMEDHFQQLPPRLKQLTVDMDIGSHDVPTLNKLMDLVNVLE